MSFSVRFTGFVIICLFFTFESIVSANDVAEQTAAIQELLKVQGKGQGNQQAAEIVQQVQKMDPSALPVILATMNKSNDFSYNWLQIAFQSIADRAIKNKDKLPLEKLQKYLDETSNNARARNLVYTYVKKLEPELAKKMIPTFINDPSTELRRRAVALWIERGKSFVINNENDQAIAAYRDALKGATDEDQVKSIAAAMKELGKPIDLQEHFGFLAAWSLIGPFDNVDMKGFNVVYPPEKEIKLKGKYAGQLGEVSWSQHSTDDDYGVLDITTELKPYKGAIVYAYTEFDAAKAQDVNFRLATPNAWKLWVNGELVFAREEYHRGTFFDQYRVPGTLNKGKNTILMKVCQNEQEDHWAQKFQIQFRICDPTGSAIHPVKTETASVR